MNMTIDNMIEALSKMKEKVGGDKVVPVMLTNSGENDYIIPSFPVIADLEDQDGNTFKCALIGGDGGEELTVRGIPHWEWNPEKNKTED